MVRPPSGGTAAGRGMGQKIRTADKKSMSSQQWIKRQLADKWSEKARAEGWRSRAAFKLSEMDEVEISARLSAGGTADRQEGDIESAAVRVKLPSEQVVELVIGGAR